MVSQIHVVRNAVKSSICKETDNAAVVVVVLARAIRIEKSQANHGNAEAFLEVHNLDFIYPFRDCVIIVLNDGMIERNVFGQDVLVFVTIDFRRRRKNQSELLAPLDFQNVPSADDVRHPQRVIVFLPIDAAEFCSQVINEIIILFKHALQLPEVCHIRTIVFLVGLMLEVHTPHIMSTLFEFACERPPQRAHYSGYQYL